VFSRRKSAIFGSIIVLVSMFFFLLSFNAVRAEIDNVKSAEKEIKENFGDFFFELIESTKDQGQNYFVNYRIKREQSRYEIKEMLKPLLESDIKHTREEAELRWLELSNKISKEDEIENTLKMRGFKDVVSEVNPEKITVTLLREDMSIQEIFMVKNVVNSITGFEEERIEIILRQ